MGLRVLCYVSPSSTFGNTTVCPFLQMVMLTDLERLKGELPKVVVGDSVHRDDEIAGLYPSCPAPAKGDR